MTSGRLLIVSNRLPVTASLDGARITLERASGGLSTGLGAWHDRSRGTWIGWPGELASIPGDRRGEVDQRLREEGLVPVHLSRDEVQHYYEGFSNRVLWPLFHYLADRVPVDASGWDAYRRANQRFADAAAAHYEKGDIIWVHDYQLMLVPQMLRQKLGDARIGFFLHVPFPSSEVFRILPWRREILKGLLGADLIGFHTYAYLRHFLASLVHVEGIEADVDRVRVGHRWSRAGVFPMSIDVSAFDTLARDPGVLEEAEAIRRDAGGRRILLGVDRLDYTKGIPRRLLALERLFKRAPELTESLRYVQVAVPSRERMDAYESFRRQVEEAVGRINGACATLRSTPIHYMYRSVSIRQLVALYRAADVMLVTPLRDGMNLVAKEFIASRVDGDGVLVLSEFAGAAAELGEAVVVNPYDVDAMSSAIQKALHLEPAERRARMGHLRRRVAAHDVHLWASSFVEALCSTVTGAALVSEPEAREAAHRDVLAAAANPGQLTLLLDYDGTLVPLAPAPELATPDGELMDLLAALAGLPATDVHLVSGRSRDTLEAWFGQLGISLWAEHGFWRRCRGAAGWDPAADVDPTWMGKIAAMLEHFTASTPGSLLERKSAALAWHYRLADPSFGARQAHELRMLLGDALSNQPLEVLQGKKVIEVRVRGVSKAIVARHIQQGSGDPARVIAMGDDRTDEDLFASVTPPGITIAVGDGPTRATHRLLDTSDVRALLRAVLAVRGAMVAANFGNVSGRS